MRLFNKFTKSLNFSPKSNLKILLICLGMTGVLSGCWIGPTCSGYNTKISKACAEKKGLSCGEITITAALWEPCD